MKDQNDGKVTRRGAIGMMASGVAGIVAAGTVLGSATEHIEINALAELDQMAKKPNNMAMAPRVTYLGGPTYLIEIGKFRILGSRV